MAQTIPDAKLHRLALTDFEVRQLIVALNRCIEATADERPTFLLHLRSQLERSRPE
jgi:hypothetical protein